MTLTGTRKSLAAVALIACGTFGIGACGASVDKIAAPTTTAQTTTTAAPASSTATTPNEDAGHAVASDPSQGTQSQSNQADQGTTGQSDSGQTPPDAGNSGDTPTGNTPTTTVFTTTPVIDEFVTPENIDCHNGNFQNFTVSWKTHNTTKVTISIDGPGIYDTYGTSGSASLPFNCSTSHTFYLTAYGTDGTTIAKKVTLQPRNAQ